MPDAANDDGAAPNQWALVVTLLIFVGLLVPVLVLPTFQFVLFVTGGFDKFKRRHLASFATVQSLKYLFMLLAIIANVDSIGDTSSLTVHLYLYFHLVACLSLCVASRASLDAVRRRLVPATATPNGDGRTPWWLRHTVALPLTCAAASALLAAIRYASAAIANQAVAYRYCASAERCHPVSHFACFEAVKFVLLAACTVDLALARRYRTRRTRLPLLPTNGDHPAQPAATSLRDLIDDFHLVTLNGVLCALSAASCAVEIVGYVAVVPNIGVVLTVVGMVEGWSLSLTVILFLYRKRTIEWSGDTQLPPQLPLICPLPK